jgi:hypothetical protein
MTSTTSTPLAELELLAKALALTLPWLRACQAGDSAAADAISAELMLSHMSYDHGCCMACRPRLSACSGMCRTGRISGRAAGAYLRLIVTPAEDGESCRVASVGLTPCGMSNTTMPLTALPGWMSLRKDWDWSR